MEILLSINVESNLPSFVGYAIFSSWTKNHLRATHEVVHAVLQTRHQSFSVNDVKVDVIICGNLDANVAFDEVNEASMVKMVILFPFCLFYAILTTSVIIHYNSFKK
jgi:hypothetical protein